MTSNRICNADNTKQTRHKQTKDKQRGRASTTLVAKVVPALFIEAGVLGGQHPSLNRCAHRFNVPGVSRTNCGCEGILQACAKHGSVALPRLALRVVAILEVPGRLAR